MPQKREGNLLSVRLSAREMAQLRALVAHEGSRVSDVVRDALENYGAVRREPTIEWEIPPGSKVYMYYGGPPQAQGLNPHVRLNQADVVLASPPMSGA